MTASAKLRELQARGERDGWDNDLLGEPLLVALPEIIAAVEAAEYVRDGRDLLEADSAHLENALDQNEAALAALTAALTEGDDA